jgi:hypothetical protein
VCGGVVQFHFVSCSGIRVSNLTILMIFWTSGSSNLRPINRFDAVIVPSGLVTAWRFAGVPTSRLPSGRYATIEGVVRAPSEFSMTRGFLPCSFSDVRVRWKSRVHNGVSRPLERPHLHGCNTRVCCAKINADDVGRPRGAEGSCSRGNCNSASDARRNGASQASEHSVVCKVFLEIARSCEGKS